MSGFEAVRHLVRERTGVSLGEDKRYLADARLPSIARAASLSIDDLLRAVARDPDGPVAAQVVDALLTRETSFFRDVTPFVHLRELLPELARARAGSRTITIWSAACASGQEPHTIALVVLEAARHLVTAGWCIRVIASDVSEEMLERTRAGVYAQHEVNRGLPAALLVKYFARRGLDWVVRDEVRALVEVRHVNLVRDLRGLPAIDVVFLRNVLIYFEPDVKRAVLERVRGVLRADGYLVLGSAETTLGVHDGFESLSPARPGCFRPRTMEVDRGVPRG